MKLEDAIGIGILLAIIVIPLLVSDALKVRKIPKAERAEAKRKMRKETRRSLVPSRWDSESRRWRPGESFRSFSFRTLRRCFVPRSCWYSSAPISIASSNTASTIYAAALANAGDSEGAVLEIRRAIEAKPDSADLWNTLAALLMSRADYDEATDALRRAAELGLDESLVRTNGAWLLWKQSLLDEALALNSIQCRTNPRLQRGGESVSHPGRFGPLG